MCERVRPRGELLLHWPTRQASHQYWGAHRADWKLSLKFEGHKCWKRNPSHGKNSLCLFKLQASARIWTLDDREQIQQVATRVNSYNLFLIMLMRRTILFNDQLLHPPAIHAEKYCTFPKQMVVIWIKNILYKARIDLSIILVFFADFCGLFSYHSRKGKLRQQLFDNFHFF